MSVSIRRAYDLDPYWCISDVTARYENHVANSPRIIPSNIINLFLVFRSTHNYITKISNITSDELKNIIDDFDKNVRQSFTTVPELTYCMRNNFNISLKEYIDMFVKLTPGAWSFMFNDACVSKYWEEQAIAESLTFITCVKNMLN